MNSYIVLLFFGFGCLSRVYSAPTRRNEDSRVAFPRLTPIDYLEKYGYLKTGVQHSPTSLESAILTFQQFAGLEQTGVLDVATREKLQARRCGVQDVIGTGVDFHHRLERNRSTDIHRFKRYVTTGPKWSKNDLTYNFINFTPDLSKSQIRTTIRKAFKLWSDVSPLSFTESSSSSADILLWFVAGWHGFLEFFDGPGGVVAHAAKPEDGDVHFDEDETFVVEKGSDTEVDLFYIAAHEFGHSIGLGHSNVTSALMYPWYDGSVENVQLHQDDIDGIQHLYGKPGAQSTESTNGNVVSGNKNTPTCDSRWDAATYYAPDDVVYAFKGQYIWAINDEGIVDGYPRKIKKVFNGAPEDVQAVVSSGRRTYMFKGKKMWSFLGKTLESGFPRAKPSGLLPQPDAALKWGGDDKIYIFKGGRFQEFFENSLSVDTPRPISDHWRGVPVNIDAALQWKNGKTYFFRKNNYWRFNDVKRAVAKDYPMSRSMNWMGCDLPEGQKLPSK